MKIGIEHKKSTILFQEWLETQMCATRNKNNGIETIGEREREREREKIWPNKWM